MYYGGGGCQNTNFRRCPLRNPDTTPDIPNPDSCTCTKEELPCEEWNNKNTCVDYNVAGLECNDISSLCSTGQIGPNGSFNLVEGCGPPGKTDDHTVYIEAFGGGELYFGGQVAVNSTYEAVTAGEKVDANTDIFTYEWIEGAGKGRLLQHVVFHSSCSQELYLTDQFGSQQLLEFDSFCDVACNDPGCKEVTGPDGVQFGRRRISLFAEDSSKLNLELSATSTTAQRIKLDQVLGLFTPADFSGPTQFFNFSSAVGQVVPPAVTLVPEGLAVAIDQTYSLGAIVTGFLDDDPSTPCQQVNQTTFSCNKVREVPCACPPCRGSDDFDGGDRKSVV